MAQECFSIYWVRTVEYCAATGQLTHHFELSRECAQAERRFAVPVPGVYVSPLIEQESKGPGIVRGHDRHQGGVAKLICRIDLLTFLYQFLETV